MVASRDRWNQLLLTWDEVGKTSQSRSFCLNWRPFLEEFPGQSHLLIFLSPQPLAANWDWEWAVGHLVGQCDSETVRRKTSGREDSGGVRQMFSETVRQGGCMTVQQWDKGQCDGGGYQGSIYWKIPSPWGGGNISRCHLGEKIWKVEEKKRENVKAKGRKGKEKGRRGKE